jgi:hypothetical protein
MAFEYSIGEFSGLSIIRRSWFAQVYFVAFDMHT